MPKTNTEFWRSKLEANRKRDRRVNRELRDLGWSVIRIWEHEFANPDRIIHRLRAVLDCASGGQRGQSLTA
jgi:DNA mismatch endonuclease (patch repair protein)